MRGIMKYLWVSPSGYILIIKCGQKSDWARGYHVNGVAQFLNTGLSFEAPAQQRRMEGDRILRCVKSPNVDTNDLVTSVQVR